MKKKLLIVPGLLIVLTCAFPALVLAPEAVLNLRPDGRWASAEEAIVRLVVEEGVNDWLQELEALDFHGAAVVMHKGQPIGRLVRGEERLGSGDALTEHSPFQLASVSKMFTAAAILKLRDAGLLDLDDPVSCHLPAWPYANQTLRHLLQHRSGLGNYMAVASWYWKELQTPMSNADVVQQHAEHVPPTFFTPDHGFNYCNTNYVVLAQVVEAVSGMSFPAFLKQQILDPLGMKDAFVYARGGAHKPEVIGYKPSRKGYYAADQDYIDGVWGDKNLYASIRDMEAFDRAIWNNALLAEASQLEAWQPGSPERGYNYGLGWRLRREPDGDFLPYHFGWWRGFRTCYLHDVKTGLSVIMLSNIDDSRRLPDYWEAFECLRQIWPVPES